MERAVAWICSHGFISIHSASIGGRHMAAAAFPDGSMTHAGRESICSRSWVSMVRCLEGLSPLLKPASVEARALASSSGGRLQTGVESLAGAPEGTDQTAAFTFAGWTKRSPRTRNSVMSFGVSS